MVLELVHQKVHADGRGSAAASEVEEITPPPQPPDPGVLLNSLI